MDKDDAFHYGRWGVAAVVVFLVAFGAVPRDEMTEAAAVETLGGAATAQYFPAQYVNQAKEAEAHIQAF